MSNRDIGDKLESLIALVLGAKKNSNSGAYWRNCDLTLPLGDILIYIEAKVSADSHLLTKRFRDDYKKAEQQAEAVGADAFLVVQDKTGVPKVVIELDLLKAILEYVKRSQS